LSLGTVVYSPFELCKQLMEVARMKRAIVIITVLLFAFSLFALVGCSKKDEPKPAPKPAMKPAPAAAPAPAAIKPKAETPAPKPAKIGKKAPKKAKKAKGFGKKGK